MTRDQLEQVLRMAATHMDHHPTAKNDPVLKEALHECYEFWADERSTWQSPVRAAHGVDTVKEGE